MQRKGREPKMWIILAFHCLHFFWPVFVAVKFQIQRVDNHQSVISKYGTDRLILSRCVCALFPAIPVNAFQTKRLKSTRNRINQCLHTTSLLKLYKPYILITSTRLLQVLKNTLKCFMTYLCCILINQMSVFSST